MRLLVAAGGQPEIPGASAYLIGIAALMLAATPESPFETGLWASLFEFQSVEERVDGAAILATLVSCTAVVS